MDKNKSVLLSIVKISGRRSPKNLNWEVVNQYSGSAPDLIKSNLLRCGAWIRGHGGFLPFGGVCLSHHNPER